MSRLSYLAYTVAAIQFARDGRSGGLVISLILMAWLVVVDEFVDRSSMPEEAAGLNGWTVGLSQGSVDALDGLRRILFVAGLMSYGLTLFAPLLALWSFLL